MSLPKPVELGFPAKFGGWRKNQDDAILDLAASEVRFSGLVAPTGSGKSLTYMAYARLIGAKRICILTSTKSLQDQLEKDFNELDVRGKSNFTCTYPGVEEGTTVEEGPCQSGAFCSMRDNKGKGGVVVTGSGCEYYDKLKKAQRAEVVVTNYAFWLSTNLYGQGLGQFDLLVLDECLPPGTLIGERRIIDLRVGDTVPSFNPTTRRCEDGRVVARTVSKATSLRKITFAGGRTLVSTPTHRVFTPQGWKEAGDLFVGDTVLCYLHEKKVSQPSRPTTDLPMSDHGSLYLVRKENRDADHRQKMLGVSKHWTSVLLRRVWEGLLKIASAQHGGQSPKGDLQENEEAQPHVQPGNQSQDENNSQSYGLEAYSAGGEREIDPSSTDGAGISTGLAVGVSGESWEEKEGLPNQLQDRHSQPGSDGGCGGGWVLAPSDGEKGTRSQEGLYLEETRVEDVEVLQPGGDGTFGGLCPDGLVYNLEIEGNHAYIAQGLAVHNSHNAPDELAGFLSFTLQAGECRSLLKLDLPGEGTDDWWGWLREALDRLNHEISFVKGRGTREASERLKRLGRMARPIAQALNLGKEYWVAEKTVSGSRSSMRWDITDPAPFADRYLFRSTPRVVLSSATVREKTLRLIGIGKDESEMLEYPSNFPTARRPVYAVGGVPRLNHRTTEEELGVWRRKIDEIIGGRLDRRGIVHTVSFRRAKEIEAASEHRGIMHLHGSGSRELQEGIGRYLREKPAVLVSPSATTGIDLPYDECEYGIVAKIPYPDMRSKAMRARMKKDPDYPAYLAAQTMVQATGRGMRAEDDQQESFVTDGNWSWFMRQYSQFTPRWWRSAVRRVEGVPRPPKALESR